MLNNFKKQSDYYNIVISPWTRINYNLNSGQCKKSQYKILEITQ